VHGIGGDVLSFRDLANHLSADQPVYGLRAQGDKIDRFSVESIAAHYINEMSRVQIDGPYYLIGYSFGGTIAFEMARQLVAQGKPVGLLALIDTYGPGYPRLLPVAKRAMIHLKNLLRARPEAKLEYLRGRVRINVIRINKSIRRASYRYSVIIKGKRPAAMESNIQAAHQQASFEYTPKVYDGRLTLFRAKQQGEVWQSDPELGWGGLAAGGVEVYETPGNHITLIAEPNVRSLAGRLSECLLRAREKAPRQSIAGTYQ
jgi:thioesterase domain-containing protein